MRRFILPLSLAAMCAAACGSQNPRSPTPLAQGADACVAIAAEYRAAFPGAAVCDPGAASPCGAERPLAVMEGSAVGEGVVTGICWMAYEGYVNPSRTAVLDEILGRYSAAGCSIGFCPGPSPHATTCQANTSGAFTCGGM